MNTPQPSYGPHQQVPQQPYGGQHYQAPPQPHLGSHSPIDDTGRPLAVVLAIWLGAAAIHNVVYYPTDLILHWTSRDGRVTHFSTVGELYSHLEYGIETATGAIFIALCIALVRRSTKTRLLATVGASVVVALYVMRAIRIVAWSSGENASESLLGRIHDWNQLSATLFFLIPTLLVFTPGVLRTLRAKPGQNQRAHHGPAPTTGHV
ncbi:hypothetical protein [Actinopolyspora saharensis]|uniref:Uncharacterized protein n=1 Tax=Actinopolyspora saharensis TaxID=995062 RepID=A0A1H1GLQ9_9ACTN|nr:hypothetical protein [Actinopolyspora saharensis]SDR14115.1 hypothetical protein SAMN04489718_3730 [Actinopolyspora saharensis]